MLVKRLNILYKSEKWAVMRVSGSVAECGETCHDLTVGTGMSTHNKSAVIPLVATDEPLKALHVFEFSNEIHPCAAAKGTAASRESTAAVLDRRTRRREFFIGGAARGFGDKRALSDVAGSRLIAAILLECPRIEQQPLKDPLSLSFND